MFLTEQINERDKANVRSELVFPSSGRLPQRTPNDKTRLGLIGPAETNGAGTTTCDEGASDVIRSEPFGTDPYAGWCGGRRLITSGYPIRPAILIFLRRH